MEIICHCNWNLVVTDVTIPLVIDVTFPMTSFIGKIFIFLTLLVLITYLITCNCIYIYNQKAVNCVNGKAN